MTRLATRFRHRHRTARRSPHSELEHRHPTERVLRRIDVFESTTPDREEANEAL